MKHLIALFLSLIIRKIWLHQLEANAALIFCKMWKRNLQLRSVGRIYSPLKLIRIITTFQWRSGSGSVEGTSEEW